MVVSLKTKSSINTYPDESGKVKSAVTIFVYVKYSEIELIVVVELTLITLSIFSILKK